MSHHTPSPSTATLLTLYGLYKCASHPETRPPPKPYFTTPKQAAKLDAWISAYNKYNKYNNNNNNQELIMKAYIRTYLDINDDTTESYHKVKV